MTSMCRIVLLPRLAQALRMLRLCKKGRREPQPDTTKSNTNTGVLRTVVASAVHGRTDQDEQDRILQSCVSKRKRAKKKEKKKTKSERALSACYIMCHVSGIQRGTDRTHMTQRFACEARNASREHEWPVCGGVFAGPEAICRVPAPVTHLASIVHDPRPRLKKSPLEEGRTKKKKSSRRRKRGERGGGDCDEKLAKPSMMHFFLFFTAPQGCQKPRVAQT